MENMLLACTSLGLGSVWLGVYPIEDRVKAMREHFGLPAPIVPFALMPIGRPGESRPTNDRYRGGPGASGKMVGLRPRP